MVKENIIPLENKKPSETVYEIKNEIPTFEEFMKTYENDGNLNYAYLSNDSINEVKGYGPCSSCSGSNRSLDFKLKILLENCMGSEKSMTVYNTNTARSEASKIIAESGHWEDEFLNYFSQEKRRKSADRINEELRIHERGESINETVSNYDCNDSRRREIWLKRRKRQTENLRLMAEEGNRQWWGETYEYKGR